MTGNDYIWLGFSLLMGLIGLGLGITTAGEDLERAIIKSCDERMYFVTENSMYLCKKHEPFK